MATIGVRSTPARPPKAADSTKARAMTTGTFTPSAAATWLLMDVATIARPQRDRRMYARYAASVTSVTTITTTLDSVMVAGPVRTRPGPRRGGNGQGSDRVRLRARTSK